MYEENIKVVVRISPNFQNKGTSKTPWIIKDNNIFLKENYNANYCFHKIFDQEKRNCEVYRSSVQNLVSSTLSGYNATIIAYGQTFSGKTHTIFGSKEEMGLLHYSASDLFNQIKLETRRMLVKASYLEILNETIYDLLDANQRDIKLRDDSECIVFDAKEEIVESLHELEMVISHGNKNKKYNNSCKNGKSHIVFSLRLEEKLKSNSSFIMVSFLTFVDLSGPERFQQQDIIAREKISVNKSLATFRLVLRQLLESQEFVNFRDSKLTRILQSALGGNSKTLFIITVISNSLERTHSYLELGQQAQTIKNKPYINKYLSDGKIYKKVRFAEEDDKNKLKKERKGLKSNRKTLFSRSISTLSIDSVSIGKAAKRLDHALTELRRFKMENCMLKKQCEDLEANVTVLKQEGETLRQQMVENRQNFTEEGVGDWLQNNSILEKQFFKNFKTVIKSCCKLQNDGDMEYLKFEFCNMVRKALWKLFEEVRGQVNGQNSLTLFDKSSNPLIEENANLREKLNNQIMLNKHLTNHLKNLEAKQFGRVLENFYSEHFEVEEFRGEFETVLSDFQKGVENLESKFQLFNGINETTHSEMMKLYKGLIDRDLTNYALKSKCRDLEEEIDLLYVKFKDIECKEASCFIKSIDKTILIDNVMEQIGKLDQELKKTLDLLWQINESSMENFKGLREKINRISNYFELYSAKCENKDWLKTKNALNENHEYFMIVVGSLLGHFLYVMFGEMTSFFPLSTI